jgi:hypothetical protein
MISLQVNKLITNFSKLNVELFGINSKFLSLNAKGSLVTLFFSEQLTQTEINQVLSHVNNFIEFSLNEELEKYIKTKVRPFLENLTFQIKASNIENGITQANKTSDFLSFMSDRVLLPGKTRPISLDTAIQNDSLDVVVQIADYYIANPGLYEDLAPFITVQKIQQWRNEIISFIMENPV